jgi:hypothetical protein
VSPFQLLPVCGCERSNLQNNPLKKFDEKWHERHDDEPQDPQREPQRAKAGWPELNFGYEHMNWFAVE